MYLILGSDTMQGLTGVERINNILQHKPVDRIGLYEHLWGDTVAAYTKQGHLKEGEPYEITLGLDLIECWPFNFVANLDFKPEILEETDQTILIKDGNGATLRRHKQHETTPEHVNFSVQCHEDWLKYRPFLLEPDERRINFEEYRKRRNLAKEHNLFFCCSSANVFELMHPICGHEYMLMGMALEPEWIEDMANVYANLLISLQEILFEREGYPDGFFYYDDLGYKLAPFMSPAFYQHFIMPFHKKTVEFAHSKGVKVIMHSCGFIEPLLPYMVQTGIDCLQVIEIKAGMDLLKVHKEFGDKIALMGGIDARVITSNDKAAIDKELSSKIPIVKQGFGYVLHSDHSIPETVTFDTLQYFINRGLELGKY